MNLPLDSENCPMCGAKLGFAKTRCISCGELLSEQEPEEGTFEFYERGNTRRWSKITGFFTGLVGLLVLVVSIGLLGESWDRLDENWPEIIGCLIFGGSWLTGGTLFFLGRAQGMWFIQPANIFLLGAQLLHLDKLQPAMIVFNLLFLWLAHSAWNQLKTTQAL